MEDITDMQKPEDVEDMDNIKNKVDSMAMEDEGGKDNREMTLHQPNSKVCSSIPIETKHHQLMDDMKATQFWQQVIQKQHDTHVKLPSGLVNELKKKNTYVEYMEEEWNEVLTHQDTTTPKPQQKQPQQQPTLLPADR
eukprot:9051297-Ditylum_brightwellii.AAC.1